MLHLLAMRKMAAWTVVGHRSFQKAFRLDHGQAAL